MEEIKSKSRIKREMKDLQALGEKLVALREEQLADLPLSPSLREAITLAQGIKAHGGRKRQLKYIGKLLRNCDADALLHALQLRREKERRINTFFHRAEKWRDRLLEEGDTALEILLQDYPQADRQQIRILIRNARKEQAAGKPAAASRNLFRKLHQLTSE